MDEKQALEVVVLEVITLFNLVEVCSGIGLIKVQKSLVLSAEKRIFRDLEGPV